MKMFVSHVRRKQIPSYVLKDGYKQNQTPRLISGQLAEEPSSSIYRSRSGERCGLKRKKELEGAEENQQSRDKRPSISPPRRDSPSPELIVGQNSGHSSGVTNLVEAVISGDPAHELLRLSPDRHAVGSTGCDTLCSSQGGLDRTESKSLLNNVCENGSRLLEDALLELEPKAARGMLTSLDRIGSESVQKSSTRFSVTSTA